MAERTERKGKIDYVYLTPYGHLSFCPVPRRGYVISEVEHGEEDCLHTTLYQITASQVLFKQWRVRKSEFENPKNPSIEPFVIKAHHITLFETKRHE